MLLCKALFFIRLSFSLILQEEEKILNYTICHSPPPHNCRSRKVFRLLCVLFSLGACSKEIKTWNWSNHFDPKKGGKIKKRRKARSSRKRLRVVLWLQRQKPKQHHPKHFPSVQIVPSLGCLHFTSSGKCVCVLFHSPVEWARVALRAV